MEREGGGPVSSLDVYGFSVSVDANQQQQLLRCDQYAEKRSKKWQRYKAARQLPEGGKLKRYCRKGVPVELRGWVWYEVSGARRRKEQQPAGYFERMVAQGAQEECQQQIELDLPRTYPHHAFFKTSEGRQALRRVLTAFAAHRPDVGYCQSMNFVAGLLLLTMDQDQEKVFWVMVALIDDGILYKDMYSHNLAGCHVELGSLEDLLARKLPKLARHLQQTGAHMSMIATEWLLCLYASVLPSGTTARVWDSLLLEGAKVLHRVALAMLKGLQDRLLAINDPGEMLRCTKQLAGSFHDRDALLRDAFGNVGAMPMARINGFRVARQAEVDAENARRQTRSAASKARAAENVVQAAPGTPAAPAASAAQPAAGNGVHNGALQAQHGGLGHNGALQAPSPTHSMGVECGALGGAAAAAPGVAQRA